MIVFKSPEKLIDFLEQQLPPRIRDDLFYAKHYWEHKGKEIERRIKLKPIAIAGELRNIGFVIGLTDDPQRYFFPEKYVLLWTKLLKHLEQSDNLTFEQEKYKLLSINKACELMEVTRPTMYKLINQNKIPYVEVLSQKRIQLFDLLDYIDKNKKLR